MKRSFSAEFLKKKSGVNGVMQLKRAAFAADPYAAARRILRGNGRNVTYGTGCRHGRLNSTARSSAQDVAANVFP
jgi:hypothetical protein